MHTASTASTAASTANTAQAEAWNGYEGAHWAAHHDRWNAVNEGFDRPLLAAAAIRPDGRVLDVGCGAGATTRLAARTARHGHAHGLDLSGPMLERARTVAAREGLANVSFTHGDAQTHPLPEAAYDVAISRFGVMFFSDPAAAFANIASALRPGGRVAFLCAAEPEGNDWLTALTALADLLPVGGFGSPGGPGMFSLADPGTATGLLRTAGLGDVRAEHVSAPGTWGRTAREAADFLLDSGPGRHLLGAAGPDEGARARDRLTDAFRAHEAEGAVRLRSTAWLLTGTRPA
ncbi:class I SAM-dependent methyltransferase [Streptomyces lavendulae]|uniref:class I SAM-dependent methyltransferase n=1 Tax=Streptomyces lavendulae TaxID=1914 RepID=UPI0024A01B8D|nr:methyltransferase domain-containing protein [Streptomyces lavendulae]GLX22016.1 methyltransferase [Streptomyces lavendulae subsp. lavendulae]GLX29724.1 methyltransferase [Streptomyces lavendulae subsp. lavendulae]